MNLCMYINAKLRMVHTLLTAISQSKKVMVNAGFI